MNAVTFFLSDLHALTLLITTAVYAVIALIALWQHAQRGITTDWLGLLAVAAASWGLVQLSARLGWYAPASLDVSERLALYAALTFAGLLVHFCRAFLRQGDPGWSWLGLLGAWLVLAALLEINFPRWPEEIPVTPGLLLIRAGLVDVVLIGGWAFMVGGAAVITFRALRQTQQPLHRNRIAYWAPILALTVLGHGLVFVGLHSLGNLVVMAAMLLATAVTLQHSLLDMRQTARLVLAYALALMLLVVIEALGYFALEASLMPWWPQFVPVTQVALAVLIAVCFAPLLRLVERGVNRLLLRRDYDPSRVVRDYSVGISNILDVNELAKVSLAIIRDSLGAQHGQLFLVDRKIRMEAPGFFFELRSVGDPTRSETGVLDDISPVAQYLYREYRPLTQYDIDLLPRFQSLSAEEREWLAKLQADVYVPVYSQGNWIGLFALGPKLTRDRYFDHDLQLLSTLADQTTVALVNARLVDNLVRMNEQLRAAYEQRDQYSRQLADLDRAKSDFIAVLSHELRTPLSILTGYSQLLATDPEFAGNPANRPLIEGMTKGGQRLQEIVDLMIDMAAIDNEALSLYHEPAPVAPVIRAVAEKYQAALLERNLRLTLDPSLDSLPSVEADTNMLGKVFYHLLGNAIKYTPDGGQIAVSGRTLDFGHATMPDGGIEVVISDSGIGIPPDKLELIFSKFYRTGEASLHSSGKTKFKGGGPGLGLAIARGIIEAHGGRLWAESRGYDEERFPGSHFHVVLPRRSKTGSRLNGAGKLASFTGPLNVSPVDASRQSPGGR
jgi:signal transduction histidine kinase